MCVVYVDPMLFVDITKYKLMCEWNRKCPFIQWWNRVVVPSWFAFLHVRAMLIKGEDVFQLLR